MIRDHLRRCRALLFPGEEDFGIVPVEAKACGTPVIAFGRGGATETVVPLDQPGPTGVWFEEQTVDSLVAAIERLERGSRPARPGGRPPAGAPVRPAKYEADLFDYLDRVLAGRA